MTPTEQAATVAELQALIIARDEEIASITADRDAARRQVKRQAGTILDYRGRMREAVKKVAHVYVNYGHVFHDHVEETEPLDLLDEVVGILTDATDKEQIGGET
jgi:hypothetical protein